MPVRIRHFFGPGSSIFFRIGKVSLRSDSSPVRTVDKFDSVGAKGWRRVGEDEHQMIGYINPKCARCGKTAMEIARAPRVACRRATLPFDEPTPAPMKAEAGLARRKAAC